MILQCLRVKGLKGQRLKYTARVRIYRTWGLSLHPCSVRALHAASMHAVGVLSRLRQGSHLGYAYAEPSAISALASPGRDKIVSII